MKNFKLSYKLSGEIKTYDNHDIELMRTQGDWYRTTYEIRDTVKDEMVSVVRRNKFSLSYQHLIFDNYQNYLATLKFTKFYRTNHLTIHSSLGDLHAVGHLTDGIFDIKANDDTIWVSVTKSDQNVNTRNIQIFQEDNELLMMIITIVAFKMGLMMVSIN